MYVVTTGIRDRPVGIAGRVRWGRTSARISQRTLDRLAGLKIGHVGVIEARPGGGIDALVAQKLADALHVDVTWLITGSGPLPDAGMIYAAVQCRLTEEQSQEARS